MIRILFTGVGRRIELLQAFRNAALVLNKDLKIYGADMAGTAPALAYCDYTREVVAMNDPKYINNLIEICREDEITGGIIILYIHRTPVPGGMYKDIHGTPGGTG